MIEWVEAKIMKKKAKGFNVVRSQRPISTEESPWRLHLYYIIPRVTIDPMYGLYILEKPILVLD